MSAFTGPLEDPEIEEIRVRGNNAVASGKWEVALAAYTEGLSRAPDEPRLLANVAFVQLKLGRTEASLASAKTLVEKSPAFVKGHARLIQAQIALGRLDDARKALRRAQKYGPEDKNVVAVQRQLERAESEARKGSRRVFNAVFQRKRDGHGLYEDRPDVLSADPEERRRAKNRQALEHIARLLDVSPTTGQNHLLEGVFAKLLEKKSFHATVFPGLNREQLVSAPSSIGELLDVPAYRVALEEAMPRVRDRAQIVLTNVKRKGAEVGDIMDADTESQLWPSVLQESFARELVRAVRDVHSHLRNVMGRDPRLAADTDDERAAWDQLPFTAIGSLFYDMELSEQGDRPAVAAEPLAGTAVIDSFLGSEWVPLVRSDIERMRENGLITNHVGQSYKTESTPEEGTRTGFQTVWLDEDTLVARNLTGLQEVLQALQGLPHELNHKLASFSEHESETGTQEGRILAARPLPGSSLLVCTDGDFCGRVPMGCDAGQGCLVSAMYVAAADTLSCEPTENGNAGGTVLLHNADTREHRRVEIKDDRLILWRSHTVLHERKELNSGESVNAIYFWIYNADGEVLSIPVPKASADDGSCAIESKSLELRTAEIDIQADSLTNAGGFLQLGCGYRCVCKGGR